MTSGMVYKWSSLPLLVPLCKLFDSLKSRIPVNVERTLCDCEHSKDCRIRKSLQHVDAEGLLAWNCLLAGVDHVGKVQ